MWIHVRTITYFCFIEKLSEAHNRLETFGIVAQEFSGSRFQGDNCDISVVPSTKRRTTNLKQIKMAVGELYLSLAFLQKYQVLFKNLENPYYRHMVTNIKCNIYILQLPSTIFSLRTEIA